MYLTKERLDNIEELAYQLFSPLEIAIALEIDSDELIDDINTQGSDTHRSFYKGYLRQIGEIRTDTIKAARNGSNPALIELLKCIGTIQLELCHG